MARGARAAASQADAALCRRRDARSPRRTGAAAAAATRQADAATALPPLRQAEVEAAAELQRLTIARASLEEEEKRVLAAAAEAERRRSQTEADIGREQTLAADAAAPAIQRLIEERAAIESAEGEAAALVEEAARALSAAETIAAETEAELLNVGQALAAGEARETALTRRAEELTQRLARLRQRREEIAAERAPVEAALRDDADAPGRRGGADRRRREPARTAEAAADAAADRPQPGGEPRSPPRASRWRRRAAVRDKLRRGLRAGRSDRRPRLRPLAAGDRPLTVAAGYETALGAALGDDLTAAADEGAPAPLARICRRGADAGRLSLPDGRRAAVALMCRAPPCWRAASPRSASSPMKRRAALWRPHLAQGQRLVSRDGALWRWDGFTIAAGAPTAAAVRLSQRNRHDRAHPRAGRGERDPERGRGRLHRGAQRRARRHGARMMPAARPSRPPIAPPPRPARRVTEAPSPRRPARRPALGPGSRPPPPPMPAWPRASRNSAAVAEERSRLPDLGEARARLGELKTLLAEKRGHLVECRSTATSACAARRRPGASA